MTRIAEPPGWSFARGVSAIALGGVVLRALYVLVAAPQATSAGSDWQFYHETANLIVSGHGFSNWFVARTQGWYVPTALHPPLYPLALSLVSWVGGTTEIAHRLTGVVFGGATIVAIGAIGRNVGGERVGLVAAALAAVQPHFIAVDGSLMSESLYGLLIVSLLLVAFRYRRTPGARGAALLGVVLGLAALTRSEALLLVPLLVVPLVWSAGQRRARDVTVAVAACTLVLAPWATRNAIAFGRLVLTSTNGGTVIAGANCDPTYYGREIGGWEIACCAPWQTTNEAEQATLWARDGERYASAHLGRLPVVVAARELRVWNLWPATFWNADEGHLPRVDAAGTVVYFLLLPFALYGFVVCRRGDRWMFLAPAMMVAIAAAASWGLPRLRFASDVALVVPTAVAIEALWRRRALPRNAGTRP